MNIFSGICAFFASLFLEGKRADEEREQQGPEGVAYGDALQRETMAHYKAKGTFDGFDYDAFGRQFEAYWDAHGNADGFKYQPAVSK